jgi:diguanylate cyclase (GGDEF)-like protein
MEQSGGTVNGNGGEVAVDRDLERLEVEKATLLAELEECRRRVSELSFRAFHDPLTQLPNRALFFDRLEHALAARRRDGRGLAVLFCDLDDFKLVNDELGHATGDRVLMAVAESLQRCVRPGDTAARLGGDEFAVLLEGGVTRKSAVAVARRMIESLGRPFHLGGVDVRVGACVGIALGASRDDDAHDLVHRADMAMYEAKRARAGSYALASNH